MWLKITEVGRITDITALEVLDSRGNPTVMATVTLDDDTQASAIVPSGASTGAREACELRDGDSQRWGGKGVSNAINNVVNRIAPALKGKYPSNQEAIDQIMLELDGTPNKTKLGANAMLGVSVANLKAAALSARKPLYGWISELSESEPSLPIPMLNILNGGAHAANSTDFQEFMVAPLGFPSFRDALRAGSEVYASLKRILTQSDLSGNVGDEGGYAPGGLGNGEALAVIAAAIEEAGYRLGSDLFLALDVAASELYSSENGQYHLKSEGRKLSGEELCSEYLKLASQYPIYSIEDPFAEDDWGNWSTMLERAAAERTFPQRPIQIVGDDLFVTQVEQLQRGIEERSANAILIKLNQVGTVTETLATMKLARENNFNTIVSHRSGDSEDPYIADLAVGTGAGQIKTGAPARGERTAKYNRLLVIESGGEVQMTTSRYPVQDPRS